MKKNLVLLTIGLLLIALTLVLQTQNILSQTGSSIGLIIALIITVIPLFNLVFKKLRK